MIIALNINSLFSFRVLNAPWDLYVVQTTILDFLDVFDFTLIPSFEMFNVPFFATKHS